jgi:uncharacterized protein YdhG (YjbR/CyaY superfamily)
MPAILSLLGSRELEVNGSDEVIQMANAANKPSRIAEYIAGFPKPIQEILQQLRAVVREAAPEAEECISYGMPAFRQGGILVYFAAFKSHIGFYPTASGIEKFQEELAPYRWAKGSVQFPLDQPLPDDLIRRMVQFRVGENLSKKQK